MGTDENSEIATTLNNMATIYVDLDQMEKAQEVYQRAYGIEKIRFVFYLNKIF